MLAKRLIPCLDIALGRVVKGVHFQNLRDAGDPVEVARHYEEEGADELVFLDISASHEGRDTMLDVVRRVAEECYMPLTVGGGIRSVEDATRLIQAGAEKVSLNTTAVLRPEVVSQIARRFGSCATVVNIDPKRVPLPEVGGPDVEASWIGPAASWAGYVVPLSAHRPGQVWWQVHIQGGRAPTGKEALSWAREVEQLGAGEIILTSMDADGTRNGYDLEMTRAVAGAVGIPVVASGGAGTPEHLHAALTEGLADAVLAASMFHFQEYSIAACKRYLADRGVCVRL
ncbi:MAG TPA: imidazole glycerol phosphate synthase subunit HisF [Gemmatales bacterium]|nr:imidazole glycerol phosphate synthase subunit HisF [Gemmatales bacterium]HMP59662.1 imidazole glycerol phosphate synthase subunit HisF [Gemmatales bacterium]